MNTCGINKVRFKGTPKTTHFTNGFNFIEQNITLKNHTHIKGVELLKTESTSWQLQKQEIDHIKAEC